MIYDLKWPYSCVYYSRVTRKFLKTSTLGVKLSRHGPSELTVGGLWKTNMKLFSADTLCTACSIWCLHENDAFLFVRTTPWPQGWVPDAIEFYSKFGFTIIMPYLYSISSKGPCVTTPISWPQSLQWIYVLLSGHRALEHPSYVWEISHFKK